MDSRSESRDEFFVVGLRIRTKNSDEADAKTAKIGKTVKKFYSENIAARISNRTHPERVVAVYSDYVSDATGEYSYAIGLEVADLKTVPDGLVGMKIAAATYRVFTTPKGRMPDIIINAWKRIWSLDSSELGGARAFSADFEVYDERSRDPLTSQVDVWIGIKK